MLLRAVSATTWLVELQTDRLGGQTSRLEDYVTYFAAGRMVLDGRGDELYDVDSVAAVEREAMGRPVGGSGILPYFNPPFVAVAVAPLALLDVGTFSTVLLVMVLAMVLLGGLILSSLFGRRTKQQMLFFWLAYLTFNGTVWMIAEQQLSMFLFLGWLGFACFQAQGKSGWSALSLSMVLVKPQMALLPVAILVWHREWKTLRYFSLACLTLAFVSVLLAGPGVIIDYPRFLLESTRWESQGVNASQMYGWNSLVANVTGDESPSALLVALLILPTLAVVAYTVAGNRQPGDPVFFLQIGAALIASLLINPHLYLQDLVLIALGAGLLAAYYAQTGRAVSGLASLAITLWLLTHYGPRLASELSLTVIPIAMACLLLRIALLVRQERKATEMAPVTASLELAA
jgi:hypothetical protein